MIFEWLIIGGGIHGVHIAARLIDEAGVKAENIRIVDPGKNLLERWKSCTETTGMGFLRSPSVHNLATEPMSLMALAESLDVPKSELFAPPYNRPSLQFFNEHCARVISRFNLDTLHVQGRAINCQMTCDYSQIELCSGEEIFAKNVVLAMGASEQPFWPKWAKNGGDRVHHIFDPKFLGLPTKRESIAVVGGGISAGQVALRLQKQGNEVHLVSRHEIREHQFDSEPGWLGPRYMNGFSKEKDFNNRRKMITHARHRGSLPPDVNNSLQQAIICDQITRHECGISNLKLVADGICLEMNDGSTLQVERILLATGFATNRPGGKFVDQLIETASLPCSECGYPIVDETLCWHPGIYVSGPLAELELGPSSRNISGARRAAKRIVKVARSDALIF